MPTPQTAQRIVTTTTDFCELAAVAEGWDQKYSQMSPGPFEGKLDLLQVGDYQILREKWSRRVRAQVAGLPGYVVAALPMGHNGDGYWRGNWLTSDTVALLHANQEGDMLSSENWDMIVLEFPEKEACEIVSALLGSDDATGILNETIDIDNGAAMDLRRRSNELLGPSAGELDAGRIDRQLQQYLRLFLWQIVQATDHRAVDNSTSSAAALVRKATELGLSDDGVELGLVEICKVLGVSLRTLHNAFRKELEIPPATWLRRIRLNRVYKALLNSSPTETMIQDVAFDHGFVHMGHFGQHYRRHFGCTPTQTLHSKLGVVTH